MGDIEKRLNKTAFKKASAWGTEVDVNAAGTGLLALNPGVPQHKVQTIEDESAASPFEHDVDLGNFQQVDFSADFEYRYGGIENVPLAMIMGTAGTPTQQGATTAWLHTLQLANKIAGLFGTYATEKHDKIIVVPSVKPHKAAFSMNNGLLKLSIGCRGNKVINDSSVVTGMSSVTYPDLHNRALFRQAVFRMNAQGGAALADGDKIYPKNFSIEIERKVDAEFQAGTRHIIEPLETDKPTVKVTLEFSRMDDVNDAYFADWIGEAEKKMDIVFTGSLIADTYYHYLKFQFPRLKVEDVDYPEASIIPAKIVLRGLEADAAPTGMTGITKPVQITVMNKRTADLLG